MNSERDKIIFDIRRQTGVIVRLVFEPLTGSSGRCRAEIDQQRLVFILGFGDGLVGIFDPVD